VGAGEQVPSTISSEWWGDGEEAAGVTIVFSGTRYSPKLWLSRPLDRVSSQQYNISMQEDIWQNFGKSTFTHIGRNDRVVDWALRYREARGLSSIQSIVLLGSGVIEPFTLAALPSSKAARVIAVEINPQLLQLGVDIKAGKAISWQKIAELSKNPGRPNRDLTDRQRLIYGLKRLEEVGSKENLGVGFNEDYLQASREVAAKVQFIDQDAITALQQFNDLEMIGDFFLQANLNKTEEPGMGLNYTQQLVDVASRTLAPDGIYLIGDTGKNLPITFDHLAQISKAKLQFSSLSHAVNLGKSYITSSYLVVSKMEDISNKGMIEAARWNITNRPHLKDLQVREENVSVADLAAITKTRLLLAYISTGKNGIAWNSADDLQKSLSHLVPEPASSFSQTIVLPAQKTELEVTM
jgi:SAM-dependent methyltransferase